MTDPYIAAREEGKYRAIGGHKARWSRRNDPVTFRPLCDVCDRPLTWDEQRHMAIRRKRTTKKWVQDMVAEVPMKRKDIG